MKSINTLSLAHAALAAHIRPGDFCIDATAGRGHDTAFLCSLVGEAGRVLALDIQQEAVESTRSLLEERGFGSRAQVINACHSTMERYARPGQADCIVFNLGYLPGGDHALYTRPETTIPAIGQGLTLLREGGLLSLCIYYGGDSGYEERDALLAYLKMLDPKHYTVLYTQFYNRAGDPPIPIQIFKQG